MNTEFDLAQPVLLRIMTILFYYPTGSVISGQDPLSCTLNRNMPFRNVLPFLSNCLSQRHMQGLGVQTPVERRALVTTAGN